MWELAAVVLFTTVAAPAAKLGCMLYVLARLCGRSVRPAHLRAVFAWVEHLRPWSMIEVYLLGVFVAYVKLQALVFIETRPRPLRAGRAAARHDRRRQQGWIPSSSGRRWTAAAFTPEPFACGRAGYHATRPSAATPAAWCAARPMNWRVARAAATACIIASRTASPAPGRWARGRDALPAGQPLSGADGGAARCGPAQHHPGRWRSIAGRGSMAARLLVFVASIAVPMLKLTGLTFLLLSVPMAPARSPARPHRAVSASSTPSAAGR